MVPTQCLLVFRHASDRGERNNIITETHVLQCSVMTKCYWISHLWELVHWTIHVEMWCAWRLSNEAQLDQRVYLISEDTTLQQVRDKEESVESLESGRALLDIGRHALHPDERESLSKAPLESGQGTSVNTIWPSVDNFILPWYAPPWPSFR